MIEICIKKTSQQNRKLNETRALALLVPHGKHCEYVLSMQFVVKMLIGWAFTIVQYVEARFKEAKKLKLFT